MQLNTLVSITKTGKKRLGQGHGSGRMKTAGRGTKGQKARGSISLSFEGGALPLIKRMPFMRGKGKNKVFVNTPVVLNVSDLNAFPKGSVIDVEFLAAQKLVKAVEAKRDGIKILGDGELTVALTVKLPVSKSAQEKIEKAGGKVEL